MMSEMKKTPLRRLPSSKAAKTQTAQYDRFLEAANDAGADGEGSGADTLMGRMAAMMPEPKSETSPIKG